MIDDIIKKLEVNKNRAFIIVVALVVLDAVVFWHIFHLTSEDLSIYFLNVGQGDSELVVLPGGVRVLIDGGPLNGGILEQLARVLPSTDRYIDLVLLSHPQQDHFGGLIDIVSRYRVGAFIMSDRTGTAKAFADLERVLKIKEVPHIVLARGDSIRYKKNIFYVLAPTSKLLGHKDLNDATLVLALQSQNTKALFTGDIDADIENLLVNSNIGRVDILKVSHHGSRYSSTALFLDAIHPAIAVTEVGKNSYGHPSHETIERLQDVGAVTYRTDRDGTILVQADGEKMSVFRYH
ncbi:MBL fold metallo-hydrolase [Candidatus Jorgensenbacteria bacterium]|nr:MBL fold metallo-hydrolase [Candidatus Jorgensenbacteria bacterium]